MFALLLISAVVDTDLARAVQVKAGLADQTVLLGGHQGLLHLGLGKSGKRGVLALEGLHDVVGASSSCR